MTTNIIKIGQFQGIPTQDAGVLELMRRLELLEQDLRLQFDQLLADNATINATLATKADKGNIGA